MVEVTFKDGEVMIGSTWATTLSGPVFLFFQLILWETI